MSSPGTPTLLVAGVTNVGKVRTNNEDAHWVDADAGIAILCDGMGGHASGEVASKMAVELVRERWTGPAIARLRDAWVRTGTPASRRALIVALREAVLAANQAIIEASKEDRDKHGMGTTFTAMLFVGGEAILAHAGDSRAYLIREGTAQRVTEDHTLLARLAEAGVDTSEGDTRWKGVVTNALGVGEPTWIATSAVPLADGDRVLLCSDGVSEYFEENELAAILGKAGSPHKLAEKLVATAVERGGHDNATAVVVKVVEAGAVARTAIARRNEEAALSACALLKDLSPQKRLRALRVASEHTILDGESLPARFLGDRVAWIVLDGRVLRGREHKKPGGLLYPEVLVSEDTPPSEWTAKGAVRALAVRADDLAELASDEPDVGEKLYAALAEYAASRGLRRPKRQTGETGEF